MLNAKIKHKQANKQKTHQSHRYSKDKKTSVLKKKITLGANLFPFWKKLRAACLVVESRDSTGGRGPEKGEWWWGGPKGQRQGTRKAAGR